MVQIIVLAAVAFFLFWRLKSVLGSRQGFENPKQNINNKTNPPLKAGDIVKINPNILSQTGSAIGAVVEPVSGVVTALSLFKLLN